MTATTPTRRLALPKEEPEIFVWLTLAVALLIGLVTQVTVTNRTDTVSEGGITVSYPARWASSPVEGALFSAADVRYGGPYAPRVTAWSFPRGEIVPSTTDVVQGRDEPVNLNLLAATNWGFQQAGRLASYSPVDQKPVQLSGGPAVRTEYVYLSQPLGGVPALIRAYDLVSVRGERVYVLTVSADSREWESVTTAQFPRLATLYDTIASSVRLPAQ